MGCASFVSSHEQLSWRTAQVDYIQPDGIVQTLLGSRPFTETGQPFFPNSLKEAACLLNRMLPAEVREELHSLELISASGSSVSRQALEFRLFASKKIADKYGVGALDSSIEVAMAGFELSQGITDRPNRFISSMWKQKIYSGRRIAGAIWCVYYQMNIVRSGKNSDCADAARLDDEPLGPPATLNVPSCPTKLIYRWPSFVDGSQLWEGAHVFATHIAACSPKNSVWVYAYEKGWRQLTGTSAATACAHLVDPTQALATACARW
jgi:hypothetical protein